jgi:Protein of unknown function (DUF2452)
MDRNPIDKDKIALNPSTLPYAHSVGGAVIKPIDQGKVKGQSLSAMRQQTHMQMDQIRKQIELLAQQAEAIHKRIEISEKIYDAELRFEPVIGYCYHLYERANGKRFLSMVGPEEWGRSKGFSLYLGSVRLLADHTWDLLEEMAL